MLFKAYSGILHDLSRFTSRMIGVSVVADDILV
jgi:hypothetical protein